MLNARSFKPKGLGACPTFFLARCREASRGGTDGYEWAAYSLIRAIGSLIPYDLEEDEWFARLDELSSLIEAKDDETVLAWFERWLPRCMALVPRRRRTLFLKGVYRYVIGEGNGVAY
jgi:hypothetical protein